MTVVCTIGYEGTDIDRLIDTLLAVGVRRVADVRAVPLSRKKGFSKKQLSIRLQTEGIDYLHFGALGDPKPGREAARAGLYEKFRGIYSNHLASYEAQLSLKELMVVARQELTCLLCFERDPVTCHRLIVANEMARTYNFDVLNIYGDDPDRYVRNASRIPRYHPREGTAAA